MPKTRGLPRSGAWDAWDVTRTRRKRAVPWKAKHRQRAVVISTGDTRHTPPFFLVVDPAPRPGPRRQGIGFASLRALDGEDRAATMHYEGKRGNLKPWEKAESETAGL